ncbi:hypothetical protein ACS0TY_011059 [Phlomoides rotata]
MAQKYYNLILQCQESDEAREIIENSYNRDFVTINTMINSTSKKQVEHFDANVNDLDPEHSITKGRSKRIKGHFQRNKKKKKKKSGDTSSELPPPTPHTHPKSLVAILPLLDYFSCTELIVTIELCWE